MEKSRMFKIPGTIFFLLLFCLSLLFTSCAAQSVVGSSPSPSPTAAASATTSPVLCKNWRVVNGPTPGNYYNSLNGVAAVSASDAWGVGSYEDSSSPELTLTEHWNGSTWQIVKSPNPSNPLSVQLSGVAALSSGNVWAVGTFKDQQNIAHALIEHWNGSAWSIVSSPTPNGSGNQLYSVAVISPSNVWAVGTYSDSHLALQTLIEHWNGSAWSIVSSPQPQGAIQSQLLGVTAISANNVWAVGRADGKWDSNTLIEHWNGSQWSISSSPNTQEPGNILMAVTAISGNNIWAVGSSFAENGAYLSQSLIEHWNGSSWSIVSSPNVANSQHDDLLGVAAVSSNNIWAVGRWDAGSQNYRTLIEHWNGTAWSIVSSPTDVSNPSAFQAVTRVPALTTIWAVGSHFSSNLSEPLIERYC